MSEKKPAWKGTTGGGNFGQRALLLLFRYVDIRVGYAILGLVIPFYMIFNRSGYKAIKDYFRRKGYSGNINCHIYRNPKWKPHYKNFIHRLQNHRNYY